MINGSNFEKVVIVTGASGGVGSEIALELNRHGWAVVIHGRDSLRLQHVKGRMADPSRVVSVVGDISISSDRESLVTKAVTRFGRVDALVNNAGVFSPKAFLDVSEADLDEYLNTNLKSTYFMTQAVLPMMIEQKEGSILNIGSVMVEHALGGVPSSAPMCSKGAIHAFSRQIAAEFGEFNIRTNTLAPGIIRSPMHKNNGYEDDSMAGLHLLNRIGEPEEIASMVREIIENGFMTGATINFDGGHVAGHHIG